MAPIVRPTGSQVGRSFIECTATSMLFSSSAVSISLQNRPLPPSSASGRSFTRSPVVVIATTSRQPGAASSGWAASSAWQTRAAWTRASGEPRVPMRRRGVMSEIWL